MTIPFLRIRELALAAVLLNCSIFGIGCGRVSVNADQRKLFADRVAPALDRILRELERTNACVAGSDAPMRSDDVVCTHSTLAGSLWVVYRDRVEYALELRPHARVTLASLVVDDPRIRRAVSVLQEVFGGADPAGAAQRLDFAKKLGNVDSVNAMNLSPSNEWRLSANRVSHVAQALGYRPDQGGVIPGKDVGIVLHYGGESPNGLRLLAENSGGYVGLYSAGTSLSSVDLVVFTYGGKVQAILQGLGSWTPARPLSSAPESR